MRSNILGSLAFAVVAAGSTGCMVEAHGHVAAPVAVVEVESEPPPPRQEVFEVRPGFLWIEGRWNWSGGQWVWMNGHYERERAGYVWAPGRWEARGSRHVWVEGSWRAGAGPAVRDHRNAPPGPAPGPVVRDHRD